METTNTIKQLLDRGVLIDPDLLSEIEKGKKRIPKNLPDDILVLEKEHLEDIPQETLAEDTQEKPAPEKKTEQQKNTEQKIEDQSLKITYSYDKPSKKRTYQDFVQYFRHRFHGLAAILRQRRELQGVTSISRVLSRREDNNAVIIGMVLEKVITKNNNVIIKLEDPTGEITIIFHQRDKKLLEQAKDIVLDEVIGITGTLKDTVVFADKIFFPDIPLGRELKKQPTEDYMIVVGDPQLGSKEFLKKEFETMLAWLNGKVGSEEQKNIAKKTKYAIFVGDVVEGVGVYPGQEEDLLIKDIKEQYDAFAEYLKQIPSHIKIVICPGNHDAGRIAEPQPPLYKDFAEALYALPNVTIVSSPSCFTIGATKTFPGFDVLLYHGYSLIYYSDNIPSVRNAGGQKATDKIMQFLLQKRHLAPTHGSNMYIPDAEEDPLIIKKIPDFFLTGHVHRIATANYRNVTMINGSAWTDITEDQEKRGLEPQPGRLPIVNLKTREVKVMNFYGGKK